MAEKQKTNPPKHQICRRSSCQHVETEPGVSPSLAMDADAPLCLQRGRNSCGSRGSPQRDTVLALSRGLAWPATALLSASSWSLWTASKEKVSPFSCREEKMKANKVLQRRRVNICFSSGPFISFFHMMLAETSVRRIDSLGPPQLQIQPS